MSLAQQPDDKQLADQLFQDYKSLKKEISKVIVGQEDAVSFILMSILSRGHAVLEGVPGLAKTLLINTVSDVLGLQFNRIQFTPDLMPSDIIGAETIDKDRNFNFVKGPIFANIILADEINRTPPKTQSALLEAMQEYSVTVGGKQFKLDPPFFVLATQNPIEQEGTYPLPEAQLDRFMFHLSLGYPTVEEEMEIVRRTTSAEKATLNKIVGKDKIIEYQQLVRRVPVPENVIEYTVNLVNRTRPNTPNAAEISNKFLEWGAGPRASQNLILAAKCRALTENRYSPSIEDVHAVAQQVLKHRIVRNFKAEAEGITIQKIITDLL